MEPIIESQTTIISEGTYIDGDLEIQDFVRFYGSVKGKIFSKGNATITLGNTSKVEGDVSASVILVDGFVRGNIQATQKIALSSSARVIGNISAPIINVEFGAYFVGKCSMEEGKKIRKKPSQVMTPSPA